ncbi:MAG TPA: hypothetical protein VGK47_11870 [Nitrososphaeraceae archaeon]
MATISKIWSNNVQVDYSNSTVDVVNHDASTKGLKLGGTLVTATADEINSKLDETNLVETVTGAGAISITVPHTNLVTTAADALTLAAPTKAGLVKTIRMQTDGGDGTLASTNIVGQSSGSTSITFNDAGDYLVLVSILGLDKWAVLKEGGVTAA